MNKKLAQTLFLSIVLVFLFGAHIHAVGQTNNENNENQTEKLFPLLSLEIKTTKSKFVQLEPIPITITLSNHTKQFINAYPDLSFSHSPINVFVIKDGQEKSLQPLSLLRNCGELSTKVMKPNESIDAKEMLSNFFNKIFDKPGNYELFAILQDAEGQHTIKSNSIIVQITKPIGVEQEAIKYIESIDNKRLLPTFFSGFGFNSKIEEQTFLETFTERYKETPYWNYAAFLLADIYLHNTDKESHLKASKLAELIAKDHTFAFVDKAIFLAVKANIKLNDKEKAIDCLIFLKNVYPESKYIQEIETEINRKP